MDIIVNTADKRWQQTLKPTNHPRVPDCGLHDTAVVDEIDYPHKQLDASRWHVQRDRVIQIEAPCRSCKLLQQHLCIFAYAHTHTAHALFVVVHCIEQHPTQQLDMPATCHGKKATESSSMRQSQDTWVSGVEP